MGLCGLWDATTHSRKRILPTLIIIRIIKLPDLFKLITLFCNLFFPVFFLGECTVTRPKHLAAAQVLFVSTLCRGLLAPAAKPSKAPVAGTSGGIQYFPPVSRPLRVLGNK